MTKWDSSQVHMDGSIYAEQLSCTSLTKEKSKTTCSITSIDEEKTFFKIQHPFMIKTLSRVSIEGTHLNIIKAIHDKSMAQYNTQWRKAESLPTKMWNKTRMPTLTSGIQHSIGSPSHSSQTKKINKRYLNRKRRGKIFTLCR